MRLSFGMRGGGDSTHAALPTCWAPRSLPAAHRAQRMAETQRQLEAIQGKEQPMKGVPKSGLPYRVHSCLSGLKGHRHRLGICECAYSCLGSVGLGWGWRVSISYQLPGDSGCRSSEQRGPTEKRGASAIRTALPLEAPSVARASACSEPWDPAAALSPLQRWANGDVWLLLHQRLATSAQALGWQGMTSSRNHL